MSYPCISRKAFLQISARVTRWFLMAVAVIGVFGMFGCTTPDFQDVGTNRAPGKPEPVLLREGDVLKIVFPGAPNLNTTQQIRRDGKIRLPLVNEVTAAGKTAGDLEKELVELYAGQLLTKEINVSVESSSFSVYVSGAVLKPGKVDASRPLTAMEAIMEAGGFDYTKANLKEVTVNRTVNGRVTHHKLNLKDELEGKTSSPFYLKPSDIIFVPERFNWF